MDSILTIRLPDCELHLCLASWDKEEDLPTYERVQITDGVVGELRSILAQVLKRLSRDADSHDLILKTYEVATKPDPHEIEFLDLSLHDAILDQINSLSGATGLPVFSAADGFLEDLRFYALVLRPDGGQPLYAFRSCGPKMELNQSRYFGIALARGQYDKFDRRLFLLDRRIDCICYNGFMFVLSKGNFQHIFKFFELLQAAADETLETIRTTLPISNFDEFAASCQGHLQMLKKLKNIASQPYLGRITIEDMKRVINEAQLELEIVEEDGQEKLVFDQRKKWTILKMLDDDYLKSVMTGSQYEVNSKRPQIEA